MRNVLVIAGLDPSAGAGLLADASVIAACGLRTVGVVTATTVQDSTGVRAVHPLPAEIVGAQIAALIVDAEPVAVKIGMLGSLAIARAVAQALAGTAMPVVWDPVLMPTRGQVALFDGDPLAALAVLGPRATVILPNVDELVRLSGLAVDDDHSMLVAARALVAGGARAVLAKGGHLPGPEAVDLLVTGDAPPVRLTGPRAFVGPLHGTGCVLSSALAAELGHGHSLTDAAREAKRFLAARLAAPVAAGKGAATLV